MTHNIVNRKMDHLTMSREAQTGVSTLDTRFNYEPLFFKHPGDEKVPCTFLGKSLDYPFWISSMTGGAEMAMTINQNFARLCGKYRLGMGLGSCRALLYSKERLADFSLRKFTDSPLLANLGIAQIQQLAREGKVELIHEMVKSTEADGLIIHLNPLQEWFQPEGDRYFESPFETLSRVLENFSYPVMIKEVGHGLGPRSLAALLKLPIHGIEFGAFGGTNFTLLESMREKEHSTKSPFIHVGHSAAEMVEFLNALPHNNKEFIISGGIKNILDGHALTQRLKAPALIGMAQPFLGPAMESFEALETFFLNLRESYLTARGLLTLKEQE